MKFILKALAELREDLAPLLITRFDFLLKSQPLTPQEKEHAAQSEQPVVINHNGKYSIYGLMPARLSGYKWTETLLSPLTKEEKETLDQWFSQHKMPSVVKRWSIDDYALLKILNKGHVDDLLKKEEARSKKKEDAALKRAKAAGVGGEEKDGVQEEKTLPEKKGDDRELKSEEAGPTFGNREEKEFHFSDKVHKASYLASWLTLRLKPILKSSLLLTLIARCIFLAQHKNLEELDGLFFTVETTKQKVFMKIVDRFLEKLASNSDKVVSEIEAFIAYFNVLPKARKIISMINFFVPNAIPEDDPQVNLILTYPQLEEKARHYTESAKRVAKRLPAEQKTDPQSWVKNYGQYFPACLGELLQLFIPSKPSLAQLVSPLSLVPQSLTCQGDDRDIDLRFIGEMASQYASLLTQHSQKPVRLALEHLANALKKDSIDAVAIKSALAQVLRLVFPTMNDFIPFFVDAVGRKNHREAIIISAIPLLLAKQEYQRLGDLLLLCAIMQGSPEVRQAVIENEIDDVPPRFIYTLNPSLAPPLVDAKTEARLNSLLLEECTHERDTQMNEEKRGRDFDLSKAIQKRMLTTLLGMQSYLPILVKSLQELPRLILGEGVTWPLVRSLQELLGVFGLLWPSLISKMKEASEEKRMSAPLSVPPKSLVPAEEPLGGEHLFDFTLSRVDNCNLSLEKMAVDYEAKKEAESKNEPILVQIKSTGCPNTEQYFLYGSQEGRWWLRKLTGLTDQERRHLNERYSGLKYGAIVERRKMTPVLLGLLEKNHALHEWQRFHAFILEKIKVDYGIKQSAQRKYEPVLVQNEPVEPSNVYRYSIYGLKEEGWDLRELTDLTQQERQYLDQLYSGLKYSGIVERGKMNSVLLGILAKGHALNEMQRFEAFINKIPEIFIGLTFNLLSENEGKAKVMGLLSWGLKEALAYLRSFLKRETYRYYNRWRQEALRLTSDYLSAQPRFEWKLEKPPEQEEQQEAYFKKRVETLERELRRLEAVIQHLLGLKREVEKYPIDPTFETVKTSLLSIQEEAIKKYQDYLEEILALLKATKVQAIQCSGNVEVVRQQVIGLAKKRVKYERSSAGQVRGEYKSFLSDPERKSHDEEGNHYKVFTADSDRPTGTRTRARLQELRLKAREQERVHQQLVAVEEESKKTLRDKIRERMGRIDVQLQGIRRGMWQQTVTLQQFREDSLRMEKLRLEAKEQEKALQQLVVVEKESKKTLEAKEVKVETSKPQRVGAKPIRKMASFSRVFMGDDPLSTTRKEIKRESDDDQEVKGDKTAITDPSVLKEAQEKIEEWLQQILYLEAELEGRRSTPEVQQVVGLESCAFTYLSDPDEAEAVALKLQKLKSLVAQYKLRLSPVPVKEGPLQAPKAPECRLFEVKKGPEEKPDKRLQIPEAPEFSLFKIKKDLEIKHDQQLQVAERKRRCAELETQINKQVNEHCEAVKGKGFFSSLRRRTDDKPWRSFLETRVLPELKKYAETGKPEILRLALCEGLRKHRFELQIGNESDETRDPAALFNLLRKLYADLQPTPAPHMNGHVAPEPGKTSTTSPIGMLG